jgi:hypothetical protein
MNILLLCALFLLSHSTIVATPTNEPSNMSELSLIDEPFNAATFLHLLENYTNFTKTEPLNIAEDDKITALIEQLSTQATYIDIEIKNNKVLYGGIVPKKIDDKLRQYSDAAKTALKELHKRQSRVRFMSQQIATPVTMALETSSYQSVKTAFSTKSRIRECLLQSPILTSC